MVALLIPATSPSETSINSVLKPWPSPQRKYIRNNISAQSWASVPPEPAWISIKALLGSISPENIRWNSRSSILFSRSLTSFSTEIIVSESFSPWASVNNSEASFKPFATSSRPCTTDSSEARSLPSDCADSGLSQIFGSASRCSTSVNRSDLLSYSKVPPQRYHALVQVLDLIQ